MYPHRQVNPMAVAAAIHERMGMAEGMHPAGMPMYGQPGHQQCPPQQGYPPQQCPPQQYPPQQGYPPQQYPPQQQYGAPQQQAGHTTDVASTLHQAMPMASQQDIMTVAQQHPNDYDAALRALVSLLMKKGSQRPQAQRLHQNSYFGNGMSAGLLGGIAARLQRLKPSQGYDQFYNSEAAQHHVQPAPYDPTLTQSGHVPPTGRRKALLFASNYTGTRNELGGCIEDQRRIKELLTTNCGFADVPQGMVCLNDSAENRQRGREQYMPTKANIIKGMRWLVDGAVPGDVLFVHYSGHGGQKTSTTGMEADGKDEVIYPLDFEKAGQISDDELFAEMVRPLPEFVKLIVILDCCHSGSAMDLPYASKSTEWHQEKIQHMPVCDVILLSGCRDDQTSADVGFERQGQHISGGALTLSFLCAYVQKPDGQTHAELMENINRTLKSKKMEQVAQLSSSQRFPFTRVFDFENVIKNSN